MALIDTYWAVGSYLSRKVANAGWGKSVVEELAQWLAWKAPDVKGFSASNLWRMMQFYNTYAGDEKLATLLRELSWSKHLLLLAQCKAIEEKQFYLKNAVLSKWSHRELSRQIQSGAFERTMLAEQKLSPVMRELPRDVGGIFKDSYMLDFIDLPEPYLEKDLREGLVKNLCRFLLEPAHLGQLSFYLEALDRDRKRPHENPSIGVLLCRNKDDEVVEYALSRTLSPALVAEYEHKLISRALLKQKMHEWTALIETRNTKQIPNTKVQKLTFYEE